ncbi:hypothetical protein [Roseovarius pelagicus]|uniref:Uncharacterized protein n=1 Tax=Roseovarius pelagicus TaxID=2980108 RepID=A0ABY6DD35_9RHOB|nr:hypothetical protein [Roseovarius pelagicus]UXX83980.1 hypothetical protein N7U68_04815 [Roseovarius pelagicus]
MWGTGTDDTNTIPSVFAQSTGLRSVNFGEAAYISRQSLAMLTNAYIQRPDTGSQRLVAFYDGVNNIAYWCRHDSDLISTQRQSQIRAALVQMRAQAEAKWTFSRTFSQLSDLLTKLMTRSPQPTSADLRDIY